MATPDTTTKTPSTSLRPAVFVGLLAILAPLSYLAGRVSAATLANTYLAFLGSGVAVGALGAMIGIPIGLFFGAIRAHVPQNAGSARPNTLNPNTLNMEHDILTQLRSELAENQTLFEARKGSTVMFARIAYITPFWTSIKASGRLFVMQNAKLLSTIATAYYWLDQATRLEILAYEAKYGNGDVTTSPGTATHLISEVRLLDGQLENSLAAAITAIDAALAAR